MTPFDKNLILRNQLAILEGLSSLLQWNTGPYRIIEEARDATRRELRENTTTGTSYDPYRGPF